MVRCFTRRWMSTAPLVVQAGRRVYISSDCGTNWTTVSLPAAAGLASALSAPTSSRIYVGTENGRIYRIALVGGSWSAPVSLGRPASGYLSDILTDPSNPNRLWLTYSSLEAGVMGGRVFRSDNAGASWQDVAGDLPNIALNAIELDPEDPDTVFVAADVGVFRSTNAGAVWTAFSNGLPNALVKDLALSRALTAAARGHTKSRRVGDRGRSGHHTGSGDLPQRQHRRLRPQLAVAVGRGRSVHVRRADVLVAVPGHQGRARRRFKNRSRADVDFEFFEDDHGSSPPD